MVWQRAPVGWRSSMQRLQKSAPDWRVVNASVSGDTTQNGVQRLQPALERQHPQGVLIELAAMDACEAFAGRDQSAICKR